MSKIILTSLVVLSAFSLLLNICSESTNETTSEETKRSSAQKTKPKELPLLITSDIWSFRINCLTLLPKETRELDCVIISGESEVAGSYSVPVRPGGKVPVISIVRVGDGEVKDMILGHVKILKEGYVFAVVDVEIKNNTDEKLPLGLNDFKLSAKNGLSARPGAFKICDELYKQPTEENYAIIFPPQGEYGLKFLFVVLEKSLILKLTLPTFEEQYLAVAQAESDKPESNEEKKRRSAALFHIVQNGKWGYIDKNGRIVIDPQFDGAYAFSEGLALVRIGDKYGYIDTKGKTVIAPQFDYLARPFSEGLACVCVGDQYGYLDKSGKIVIEPQFDRAGSFSEGLAYVKVDGKYGYIDKTGKIVIEPQFDGARSFSEGLAAAGKGGVRDRVYGFIDKKGKMVIKPRLWDVGDFSEGLAHVTDTRDEKVFIKSLTTFDGKIAWRTIDSKKGYIDKTGKTVIVPEFDDASDFSERLAAVKIDKQWGYIDKKGKMVIEAQFDGVAIFSEGLARVKISEKNGYINKKGNVVIKPQFDWAGLFTNGLARVGIDDKEAYIDKKGAYIWQSIK